MHNPNFKRTTIISCSSLLAVFLILSLHFGWLNSLIAQITSPSIGAAAPPVQMNDNTKALNDALVSVYDAASPTIVSISVIMEASGGQFRSSEWDDFFNFFGFPFEGDGRGRSNRDTMDFRQRGGGSGVIISQDGYIVTNCHVVENATEDGITVTAWDKKEYPAKLIGTDSLTDLAVIKIDASGLSAAHFGNADSLKPGQLVLAIGNPMGLNHTLTQGVISALGRQHLGSAGRRSSYSIENYIQTDAAINPGNSGGGLFNLNGSLIGINTLIATTTGGFQGYGFAIPIDIVKTTATDLIKTGKVNRGYMGAAVADLDAQFAKHLGLEKIEGVLIQDINKDSPAEKADIKQEDVILEVNSKKITSLADLRSALAGFRVGDEVTLTIWRDRKKITKKVKLDNPDTEEVADNSSISSGTRNSSNEVVNFEEYGFTVEPLSESIKSKFDVKNGVYIKDVKRFSEASDRNLRRDVIILKADRENIETTGQLKNIIESKSEGETILLNLRSREGVNYMAVLEVKKKN